MVTSLADLPFRERPLLELLDLVVERSAPNEEYAGFGWARTARLSLVDDTSSRALNDVLVLALHSADDGEVLERDVELYFELDGRPPVTVLASTFLAHWLPRLPQDVSAVVLAMCNPHRASLTAPKGTRVPLHYAHGDVDSWQARHDDHIELRAPHWRQAHRVTGKEIDVSTTSERRPGTSIDDEAKQTFIGLWLLKKLDVSPDEGGIAFPVALPAELGPLDEPLQQLAVDDLVRINRKTGCYDLTKKGIAYLGEVIDEASDLVDGLDDLETDEAISELRARGCDVFRARFLWGWFDGELDDLVLWQERRGIRPVERLWAFYLTGDELWNELARELERLAESSPLRSAKVVP